ncbi:DUF937 domain-containing protein [Streptomyces sp. NPDC059009]|uniref:DUF937 domain-containing protein n=1 Tax=Streptomyces sp. NPDC059009 TaxID=3346694 RepID=UPI0036A11392
MSDDASSFEQDVLDQLGDDQLQELGQLPGVAEAGGPQQFVSHTVSALAGGLQDKAAGAPEDADEVKQAVAEVAEAPADGAAPLQGVATLGGGLGGLLGGTMMSGMLAKMSKPVASAVSKKTGLPEATVSRGIEMLIPIVLAVMAKRASGAKAPGAGAGGGGGAQASGGLGDLLGGILGGGKK